MADAQILAAERDHRRGAEAERLRAEHRRLDHVEAGLQAAVGLHDYALAQAVAHERLLRFRQTQLPRRAGVADRGQRARAGAAVVAGDRDEVGVGFGHACGDRADAGVGDELDRDERRRIHFLQVVDQLRQVFDRIDIVMRRRRNQADAGTCVAQARDQAVDLVPRQLAAFAGLGALGDLDLQHFGVDQIGRRHAETTRGDLFDLRHLLGAVAHRVFAAFARVAACAEAVHRDRERFVRLGRERAERHAGRVEALQNRFDRLDFLERHGRADRLHGEQVAQRGRHALVDRIGVFPVQLGVAGAHRKLQRTDDVGVVHMEFAARQRLHQAARRQRIVRVARGDRLRLVFALNLGEAGAADARGRAREAQIDDVLIEADDLEQLRAAITGDRRDAHLRDDLEQALLDAAAIAAADLARRFALAALELAVLVHVEQGLVRQVRVHRGRAEADQAGEVVRVARVAGLDEDVAVAAQLLLGQARVHGTGREQRVDRQQARHRVAVGQQDQHRAAAHRVFGAVAEIFERGLETDLLVVIQVELDVRRRDVRQRQHLAQLALREDRRVEQHLLGVVGRHVEHVAFQTDLRGQRHDQALAQRIDRRIRHLRERLAKIFVQRTRLPREHRDRRVVAHRTGGLGFVFGQRFQNDIALLARQRELLLIARQHFGRERFSRQGRIDQMRFEISHLLAQPLFVRRARAVDRVDRGAVEQFVLDQIDRDHFARSEAALGDDARIRHVPQAGFRGDDDVVVVRTRPARRAQAVAVQRASRVTAVAEHDAGRAVPRLGVQRVIFVERLEVFVDIFARRPRRRNQHAHREQYVEAAGDQHFEHVVEALRVGTLRRHQLAEVGKVHELRLVLARARGRPVAVGLDRVDFAVVREQAERLRQAPVRHRVGREALVEHRGARFQARMREIGKRSTQLARRDHGLGRERRRRQSDDVEVHVVRECLLGETAGAEQRAVERTFVHAGRRVDEDLLDARTVRLADRPAGARVDRHFAPAGDDEAFRAKPVRKLSLLSLRARVIAAVEKDVARGEAFAERNPGLGRERAQPAERAIEQDAAAVAGNAVRADAAAMRHFRQRRKRLVDDPFAGFPVDVRDQPETAAVVFKRRVIQRISALLQHGRTCSCSM